MKYSLFSCIIHVEDIMSALWLFSYIGIKIALKYSVVTVVEVTEAVIYNKNKIVFHYKKSRG